MDKTVKHANDIIVNQRCMQSTTWILAAKVTMNLEHEWVMHGTVNALLTNGQLHTTEIIQ